MEPVWPVWFSQITAEMCGEMSASEVELLVADLNDAVQAVCEDWGVK